MLRPIIFAILVLLATAGILFGAASRTEWLQAWLFLATYTAVIVVAFVVVDPAVIQERSHVQRGNNRLDMVLASVSFLFFFPGTLLVAGLDAVRFQWSVPIPFAAQIAALAVFVAGYGFSLWAMVTNKFFSCFVRIQSERGHHPIQTGPYALVRHPGYAGAILGSLALPFALGSLWAIVPAIIGSCLLIVRTACEDRTLKKELGGYQEYAAQVRWRLLPGVW
jgi:protein-S-isoprenylcysteine O-methyltransferase Ste14